MFKPLLGACCIIFGLSACQSAPPPVEQVNLLGSWHIETALSNPVIDNSPAQITFAEEGKLSGNNSCNRFFGDYSQQQDKLSLTPAGTTRMACVEVLMQQEQSIMKAMTLVTNIKQAKSGKLLLKSQDGTTLLVLAKQD
ncbi:META domain-containing protein [Shewanella sp. 10N.286.52.B9]|uniref:META domain-containing protein n=1 Tax=Shewanella sp. 10N.286.52.B9 TaxID=1880837 RepID=UPI000C83BFF0|nr:META domain-containing protein [Shewanella sp. 10N.286.52.B9]PMG48993.1 heat-shock protein HslJ [Shewanella sp. 10N.286.52.B9]